MHHVAVAGKKNNILTGAMRYVLVISGRPWLEGHPAWLSAAI